MNVLIVSAVFPPEPVVSSNISFDIAEELSDTGNNVTVLCPRPTRPFGYNIIKDDHTEYRFKKIVLNSYTCPESKIYGRFRESYSFGKFCYKFVSKNFKNIDVIYANTWPLFAQYFLVKAAKKNNIPVILHIQDIYPESLSEKKSGVIRKLLLFIFVPFDKIILNNCSRIVTISPNMRDYLIKTRKVDNRKIDIVRNWQNDRKFLSINSSDFKSNTLFTFMYLGSINPSASVDTLINAFGQANLNKCKLTIAGEGSEKTECMKTAHRYPDANIEFISAPADMVHKIQQQADILLLPLRRGIARTASPSKLAAYMFSGKPIIACVENDTDTAKCITEANCGFVLEPENIDKLAISMRMISVTEKDRLHEYGMNSISYAKANLSRDVNLKKITSIILLKSND